MSLVCRMTQKKKVVEFTKAKREHQNQNGVSDSKQLCGREAAQKCNRDQTDENGSVNMLQVNKRIIS